MAERSVSVGKCNLAVFMMSTALFTVFVSAQVVKAQGAPTQSSNVGAVGISIPSQPLETALRAYARQTGWQTGYAAALVAGKVSRAVSGQTDPLSALRTMLAGSGIEIRVTGNRAVSLVASGTPAADATAANGTTVLEQITVTSVHGGVSLGTDSVADTGTTTVSGGQLAARSEGGDANGVLRNLANVQYQNDVDDDAGINDQTVIDLKPREVSISGARVYENNFILDGMEINTATGSEERYGEETLSDGSPPNVDRVYGLHSQTVYVPTEFLASTTVIDSNASAKYGNFQGGVVSYKLQDAPKSRWQGSVSTDFTTSRWTDYNLATEDGLNPRNVDPNEYLKRRQAVSVGGPLLDNVSVLFGYSRESAVTEKDKYYQYTETDTVKQDSLKQFYRGQVKAETDHGDLTFELGYTDYHQNWTNAGWRNMQVDVETTGLTSKLEHEYEFDDVSLGGVDLSNLKLQSRLTYGSSNTLNDMNGNLARAYKQSYTRSRSNGGGLWESTELSDWCRTVTTASQTICYDGATGDKEQGQDQYRASEELTGDIWNGSFTLGGEFSHTKGYRRRPEDALYYGAYTSLGEVSRSISRFTCNTTEECSAEQFASTKTVYSAFDISAELNKLATYAELEQKWDWFEVRGGARLDYDDYMENLNLSPRVVATFKPMEDLAFSVGANRYYEGQSLAFAIRDQQPRAQSYTRTQSSGVVGSTWRAAAITGNYTNSASDLDTPYTDELTFSLSGTEPLLDGKWRLRFLDRRSREQYASETNGQTRTLTNDGYGAYQSFTAEYEKELEVTGKYGLDEASLTTSITWSRREVSNNSYFDSDYEDEFVWYKNQSYTLAGFNVVTGNMDIPLRLQTGLGTKWLDSRLSVDVSANYNFGYTGVKNTDQTITVGGLQHEVYEDFDFDPVFTVDLATSFKVYEKNDTGLSLNLKVSNLLNEMGNATASTTNPWTIGRTVWVGARATF
ncbi:hypothetical protein H4S14_000421 [Agrobacterium vitis]|nr:hypothetical protein [Agrobacterium vitis]MBE1436694.1 hypothetical protein [Agrobacterium vitis]